MSVARDARDWLRLMTAECISSASVHDAIAIGKLPKLLPLLPSFASIRVIISTMNMTMESMAPIPYLAWLLHIIVGEIALPY